MRSGSAGWRCAAWPVWSAQRAAEGGCPAWLRAARSRSVAAAAGGGSGFAAAAGRAAGGSGGPAAGSGSRGEGELDVSNSVKWYVGLVLNIKIKFAGFYHAKFLLLFIL